MYKNAVIPGVDPGSRPFNKSRNPYFILDSRFPVRPAGCPGMTRKGFTLIELLVVVLIIGILASVALPQYQYAVKKARFQQAITLVDALAKAQTIYFMTNGEYASDIGVLDIALPADFTASGTSARNRNLACDVFNGRIYCVFLGQGLNNVAYMYMLSDGTRACVSFERSNEQSHQFCKRLTGKENFETYGAWSIYDIDA